MNENKLQADAPTEELSQDSDSEPPEPGLQVLIANEQSSMSVNESQLVAAVQAVLQDSPYHSGSISIAVVDDPTIHEINRQYLEHDYPTDVLSFVLEDHAPYLEGELVVSVDTATQNATEYRWTAHDELLLYVIHGTLHLVGYLDKQPEESSSMRAAEARILKQMGIALPTGSNRWTPADDTADEGAAS